MDDLIIVAILRRLQSKITDLGKASQSRLHRADPVEVGNDERRLGFAVPPLLKRIYIEIGNGGFGPGYGLIGLTGGVPDDTGKNAPEVYNQLRGVDPSDPTWKWPDGLLPICHWGCAIQSCIDCTDPNFRMRIFDPNLREDSWLDDCFFEESDGFATWIRAWAAGVDLWDAMYGENGPVARILSARLAKFYCAFCFVKPRPSRDQSGRIIGLYFAPVSDALFTRPQVPFSSASGRNAWSEGIVARTLK